MAQRQHVADEECCPTRDVRHRTLLSPIEATDLAVVFKILGSETRLRLLHALVRADELCVSDLGAALDMKPQAVSNQLQRLSDLGVLESRRDGNHVYYRLVNLCIRTLLDQGLCLMERTFKAIPDRRTLLRD